MLLHILCNFTKEDAKSFTDITYIRILGFNNNGQKYINTLDKDLKNQIKTTLKNDLDITTLYELKATKLYSQLTNNDIFDLEFKIPIKKEDNNDKQN